MPAPPRSNSVVQLLRMVWGVTLQGMAERTAAAWTIRRSVW